MSSETAIAQFRLPTPPNRGAAGNRRGAASRGDCEATSERLTAIVPEYPRTV